MAFTQSDLDHLESMIAEGVLESETADGKRVRFGSFEDLRKRHKMVSRALKGRRKGVGFVSFAGGDSE